MTRVNSAGATRVLNLDLSKAALEWGKANYRANGCTPDAHDFVYGDVFDWLARAQGQPAGGASPVADPDWLDLHDLPPPQAHSGEMRLGLDTKQDISRRQWLRIRSGK